MKSKKHILLFWVLTAVFCLTRFLATKNAGSFWFDESFTVHFAQKPISQFWTFLQFEHNPLVHFVSLHYWMKVFGVTEFSARMLSVIAGLLSLFVLYWFAKKLFSKTTGLWAMFFMTLSSFFLYHQTEARMYSLITLFSLLSMGSYWMYSQAKGKKTAWLIAYTISTILLVHTHITALVLPIAIAMMWVIKQKGNLKKGWDWFLANVVILFSFLIWFIPVMQNKFLAGHVSQGWFFFQHDSGFALSHLTNYLITGEASLFFRSITALLLALLLMNAFITWQKPSWWNRIKNIFDQNHWPFAFQFEWSKPLQFLLLILFVGFSFGLALQITVTKYLLIPGIVLLLLFARGMERLPSPLQVVMGFFLFALALPMHGSLLFSQRHHWDDVAKQVKEITLANPDLHLLSHSFVWALPLEFYDYGENTVTPFYPLDDTLSLEERIVRYNWQALVNSDNVELLSDLTKNDERILLLSSTPNSDERDPVKQWFYQNGWKLTDIHQWYGYGDPELLLFEKERQQ